MDEKIVYIELDDEAKAPIYSSDEAAGADVRAFVKKELVIQPGQSALIPTGIKMEIPQGSEIQIRPRSGLALKKGITVLNSPGTIDSDYRGEVGVILINHSQEAFVVEPDMRIAQMVLAPVYRACFTQRKTLSQTLRSEGGFGHTGLN